MSKTFGYFIGIVAWLAVAAFCLVLPVWIFINIMNIYSVTFIVFGVAVFWSFVKEDPFWCKFIKSKIVNIIRKFYAVDYVANATSNIINVWENFWYMLGLSLGFLLVATPFIASIGLIGLSFYGFLKTGEWGSPSTLHILEYYFPHMLENWVGVRKILDSLPLWFSCIIVGFFMNWIVTAIKEDS